ncbi:MAG: hypothetical protein RLZZ387_3088 [Chloroflexota bacterium]
MSSIWTGKPYPLGATWDGEGVNFAIYSEHAAGVDLCLFERPDDPREAARIPLNNRTDQVWHAYLPGVRPGQLYGYRIHGQYQPHHGLRHNANKLLVDPYAKSLVGDIRWHDACFGYRIGASRDQVADPRDSGPYMPRCVVVDPSFDWGADALPRTPLHDSIIYELHVKGFTQRHPEVPEQLRGTYAGLAYPPVIEYLKELGITAVELLPIHAFAHDRHLVERGLKNYWGYNTLAYFAPHAAYSSVQYDGLQVREFKSMVKSMHAAGIEVILDVVYNHTAEGNHLGPMLSMKGIENRAYYRLVHNQPRYYMDYTGTGNSLNLLHPRTLQLVMDSLRYWVSEMHVDGFRFDLAATLARGLYEGDRLSSFLDVIHQDPVLSQVKLIAEPWDVGPGGYQVGSFPVLWAEWNGKYRDTVRRFWKGDDAQVAELAYRLTGSSDLYQHNGRTPAASINFITAHDGFTLRDLVSYNQKHNEANGEGNNDGESHNNSWNHGAEGETDDPEVNALRARQQRNLLATLLLSQGAPMLLAGDERGRTQGGNNNAYCQDNEVSWVDWELDERGRELLAFTRRLIGFRKAHPVLHRPTFFQGRPIHGQAVRDVEWYRPDGREMSDAEWNNGFVRCLGMLLNGQVMNEWDARGRQVRDDILLLLVNAHHEPLPFTLPGDPAGPQWRAIVDTASADGAGRTLAAGQPYELGGRALALLCQDGELWATHHRVAPVSTQQSQRRLPGTAPAHNTVTGTLVTLAGFWSPQLGNSRDILVYLPPDYDETDARYPVVYMHDGQNLFDETTSFAGEWRADEALDALTRKGRPAIAVGIPNMGERRIDEYSPFVAQDGRGGSGNAYVSFIVDTLKPYIDRSFRTRSDREHTGVLGSSMGGLISLYAMYRRPDVFGFAGVLSPAFWFAEDAIFPFVDGLGQLRGRVYLDTGLAEDDDTVERARRMRQLLLRKGYRPGRRFRYLEVAGAGHNEAAWAARLPDILTFLLPGRDAPAAPAAAE